MGCLLMSGMNVSEVCPIAKMQTYGGFIMEVKESMPSMPRLDIVKVPP